MFRRRSKPADLGWIQFDPWHGQPGLREMRNALVGGGWDVVEQAYQRLTPEDRMTAIALVVRAGEPVDSAFLWPDERPTSALAHLVRGTQWVASAWELRGRGYANTVDPSIWGTFHERLERAEADLHRAATLGDDGVAWAISLASTRGLGFGSAEARRRYDLACAACPGMAYAADQLLQNLCSKWLGSHEEMFDFARGTSASAPIGDPRHRLVAIAHIERALDFRADTGSRDAYRADTSVTRRCWPRPAAPCSPQASGTPTSTG